MSRSDRRAWADARTLTDLGQLMARWLNGDLKSWPGYFGDRPEEETQPLLPALIAANQAGYLTTCSQPGCDGPGHDGARWRQRAAVSGFIDNPQLLRRLKKAAAREGFIVLDGRRTPPWEIATTRDGQPTAAFGERLPRRQIRHEWDGVHPDALKALARAQQIPLVHPDYGPAGTRPLCRALQETAR